MAVGGALPSLTTTMVGFVGTDTATSTVSGRASCVTTVTASSSPGAYPIVCVQGTLAAANYSFTFATGTLQILSGLTVTPGDQTIIVGDDIPRLSYEIAGLIGKDKKRRIISGTPFCSTTATRKSSVGDYPIVCSIGTLSAKGYLVSQFNAGTLHVHYDFDGFYSPISHHGMFRHDDAVTIAFQLKDNNGNTMMASSAPQWIIPQKLGRIEIDDDNYSIASSTSDTYQYDVRQRAYVYHWSLNNATQGYWYRIGVKLDDGTIHTEIIGLNRY
jgi:hypothetical protein